MLRNHLAQSVAPVDPDLFVLSPRAEPECGLEGAITEAAEPSQQAPLCPRRTSVAGFELFRVVIATRLASNRAAAPTTKSAAVAT